jgi:uncharacterized protein
MVSDPKMRLVPSFERICRRGKPPSAGGHPGFGYRVSQERGLVVERDVAIRLRDGVTIYADVFRPEGRADLPVLLTWGPYGKHFPSFEIYARFPGCGVKTEWVDADLTIFEGPDPTHWCLADTST